ncbi:alanine racemase [Brucella daejeonensis]|nr:alanine racemase [Brucella daejeonensis]
MAYEISPSRASARQELAAGDACYTIDVEAIRHNYRALRSHLPSSVRILACLKRNGYGCGAGPVARALAMEGVDGFAVSTLPDAISIRNAGIELPILLYPGVLPASGKTIEKLDLTVTVSSRDELASWRRAMRRTRIFIKADVGFFRSGATPGEISNLLADANACLDVDVQGIYAHLSEFPSTTPSNSTEQFARFMDILVKAEAAGTRPPIAMISSTDGVLRNPEMDLDAVDPGALFFGIAGTEEPTRQLILKSALKAISTSLVSVKRVDNSLGSMPDVPGFRPGMTIGVLGMGWGDGLPRQVPAQAAVLINGRRAPLLPPVHLEHTRVDLTDIPDARFGDRVILLGQQADQEITLQELADQWSTDVVGLYGQLRDHVPRIYV